MASKGIVIGPYFFIFDFYLMQESSDSNDVLPKAISYFYPPDEQKKKDKLLDCGEIVGVVQYFQHDLFRSMAKTLYFQKSYVAHQHYGRHSGFLCVPDDRYSAEEAHAYLKHILDLFNILYGTWNHIQPIYEKNDTLNDFLNQALTPIINYVLNQHRSLSNLFSTIEYTPLKSGNQRVLLDSKHYLGYLKTKYGLHDGFIGYDDKILYSTCDPDTTFYLQLLCQSRNDISENLITIPWESDFRLRNGVSLYRIHIRRPTISNSPQKSPPTVTLSLTNSSSTTPIPIATPISATPTPTIRIPIFELTIDPVYVSDDSPPSSLINPYRLSVPSSYADSRRFGSIVLTDHSGSSEETGFDTDTADELSPPNRTDRMTSSSMSPGETCNELNTEDSDSSSSAGIDERPIPDDDKLEDKKPSRSSTVSGESVLEKTIKIEPKNISDDRVERIHFEHVDSFDTSDDDEGFQLPNRGFSNIPRDRTKTITTDPDSETSEFHRNDRNNVQVSWTNIPEKNTEHERDQLVLYVQRNSRMTFVGIIEHSLLTDDYLYKLWNLMLTQMANIEAEIQVIPTAMEIIRLTTDVRFEFNENTRLAEFRRTFDGIRYSRRIPSEESTYMAFFARTELNRHPDRKVIGLSRGSHFVSIDRRLPDRIVYLCQRFQETL